ncbi:hypothetical protein EOD41_15455 [Mucilaginibacter limnophilus]|uniref:Uncharacterized protein n=1 Tax=Mucilaginibacter limnophilus TaxID=1932778 RepID=A0A437MQE5_9SPHI|nr:hypothetical protein [Mucilaginibacter limnophilus]RVT99835.1 hypothetical protein EOD41_15455 [Mucilaginibacter limnophilus]
MVKETSQLGHAPEAKKSVVCPSCKGNMLSRIPRGFIVKTFLFWLPIKKYMCYKCQRKTYLWG